jgi:hypothetical protein
MKLIKIIYHGDFSRCQMVRKEAVKSLEKLYQSLGINQGQVQQGWKPITPLLTGELIQLHIGLLQDTINIFADSKAAKEVTNEELNKHLYCPCNCNMTIGVITDRTVHIDTSPEKIDYFIYKIDACNFKLNYVGFENVIGSDFTPWINGQKVILMVYNDFLFDCDKANFNATACDPVINELTAHTIDWRTTYRIIPLCGLNFPQWIKD